MVLLLLLGLFSGATQNTKTQTIKLGRLKYNGGGDWYSSRTALKNLANFCNQNLKTNISNDEGTVEAGSADLFNYAYVFMTGHGNVIFSDEEAANLRLYMESGGFLHICDNYGLDKYIRKEMKKVFPEMDFIELPFSHEIYRQIYSFPNGLPKVHEHDGKPATGYALLLKGRVVCFYDYECDLGNGWEDAEVYNDPVEIRTKALQMGANLIQYAFNN